MMIRRVFVAVILAAAVLLSASPAATGEQVTINRLQGEILFDGVPDEPAWLLCDPFPMVTHRPVFGNEPSERTDIRLLFDDEYIYIGAFLYTSDPSSIKATSKRRDEMKADCDWLGVILDTYNDNENGVAFWTTPTGLRTDIAIFNDAVGESPVNRSWNTHWDVKSTQNEQGWTTEILIPVSSLKFQESGGSVVMGLILIRWVPHYNEMYIHPGIPNEYGGWSGWKVSLAKDVVFPGLKSRKPLYITPYAVAGISQANELNDAETEYEYDRDYKLDAGLDLKYGISSNLTLDLTVNTDFAQVEADDEQVNLTRFDLFFEEKRQFFLERASIFDFNTGGPSTMFYSRRIGLDEDGNIVPIIGGARFIGRKGGWDMGLLNMQTMKTDSLTSENFGVLRLKKRVLNEYSYAGGIYTSRLGMDGSFNQVYGLDAMLRVTGDEYLNIIWGQSFETGMANKPLSLANARYRLGWERRRNVGFNYEIFISGTGNEYNPGIGFQHREDYHMYGGYLDYTWLSSESSPVLSHGLRLDVDDFFSMTRGVRETGRYTMDYYIEMKNNWQFGLGGMYRIENVFEIFELSDDAEIPVGHYEFPQLTYFLFTPSTRSAGMYVRGLAGGYFDGSMVHISVVPNWSISSSLTLGGAYLFSHVDLPERDQRFVSHIGRLKALVMFNTQLSLSAFIQYNSDSHNIGSNIRFRYNPREGNDLWIVYNEDTNTDLHREIPYRPRLAGRTVMLKYTYTFRF
jgi:hypothetical protein